MKHMNAKFWAINVITFLIIMVYSASWFYTSVILHMGSGPFWEASPFALVFMFAFFYLMTEGKMVQKIILAKRLKDEGTSKEYAIIDKSSNKLDDTILDRFKKN